MAKKINKSDVLPGIPFEFDFYMVYWEDIQILEGLHQDEAKVLLGMKSKTLNKMYKGLTESVVKEAFGWNDSFMRDEPVQNQNK